MRRAAVLLVLATACVPAAAAVPFAGASAAAGRVSLCRKYERLDVRDNLGMRATIYNDMFGTRAQCLANSDGWANFRVTASAAAARGSRPVAFPDMYYGCSRGWCSPGTVLPRRVGQLGQPETSWYSAGRAAGRWDASYDLWFSTARRTSGQPDGAELMIWLNERGASVPAYDGGRYVRIEGTLWYLDHWRPCLNGTCWNYVRFWRVRPVWQVRHLWLSPFISASAGQGLLRRSWWLESIAAGYELWRGGAGLATTWFWARA